MKRTDGFVRSWSIVFLIIASAAKITFAEQDCSTQRATVRPPKCFAGMPLIVFDDFESGRADEWLPGDPKAWRVVEQDGNHVYNQFVKKSNVTTPHRSPFNWSLLEGATVGDFVLDVRMQSTTPDYNHRDLCLFFGFQDSDHLYYVHFGKRTDDHANQIFIVNGADRIKISTSTTPGTEWTDDWHHARLVRHAATGTIEAYFDDMDHPAMTAMDRTFKWGKVGVGSFDDTGNFDDVLLYGCVVRPPEAQHRRN